MITNFFLDVIYGVAWVLLWPLRQLPEATLPSGLTTSMASAGGYINPLSNFLPITTLFTIMGAVLVVELGIFTWKGINWLLRRLPTQS